MGAGLLGGYSANLDQLVGINSQITQISLASSLYSAQTALQNATYEFQGLVAQMQINQLATVANINADLGNLAMRNAMGIANKNMEMAMFIGQYREKTLNMFIQMQDAKDANTWNRLKQLAGGFKY